MPTHLLNRATERPRPKIVLTGDTRGDIALERGRVHEACGTARRSFALWLASCCKGPVLWISPAWEPEQLNPDGMRDFTDPARVLFLRASRAEDLLWSVEEALRAGAVPLVIADLPAPPALTPVRRMHLAAEQGGQVGQAPLGLLLTPGQGGAQGIESRWSMVPAHSGTRRLWQLDRLRARTSSTRRWQIMQTAPGRGLELLSPTTETVDEPA